MAQNAYTGLDDETDNPLKNIVTSAGKGIESFLPQDPASKAALLQIGLGLMQPVAMGQTVAGHIGEAVGGGGEAVSRGTKEDIEQEKVQNKLDEAERRMSLRQQALDVSMGRQADRTYYQNEILRLRGEAGQRGQTEAERKQAQDDARAYRQDRKDMRDDVKAAIKERNDPVIEDKNKEFLGKSDTEIRDEIMRRDYPHLARQPAAAPVATGGNEVEQNGWIYDKSTGKPLRKAP